MITLDIDMPKSCSECPLTAYSDMYVEDYCTVNGNYDEDKRPDDCPIVGETATSKLSMWEDVDKEEISKAVVMLDLFTKTFCRYKNDYQRFDNLKFRCEECPFLKENEECIAKLFQLKYAPDYRDFGSMGDL